jgi:YVTN family beta-propeller protein
VSNPQIVNEMAGHCVLPSTSLQICGSTYDQDKKRDRNLSRGEGTASPDAQPEGKALLVVNSVNNSLMFVDPKTCKVTRTLDNIEDCLGFRLTRSGL